MKKTLLLLSLLTLNIQATTYLATLDDKHYQASIVIKPLDLTGGESTAPPISGDSPYNSGDFHRLIG
jgi:hypothetical protein